MDRRGDEIFQKSIADLSQRLGERAQETTDPQMEAAKRRAALLAYEIARKRRLKLIAGAGGAALAALCIAWFVVTISAPPEATADASPKPSPATNKVETASLASSADPSPPSATPPAQEMPAQPAPAAPPTLAAPSPPLSPPVSSPEPPSPSPAPPTPVALASPPSVSPPTPSPSVATSAPSLPTPSPSTAAPTPSSPAPLPSTVRPMPSPPPAPTTPSAAQQPPVVAADLAPTPDQAPLQWSEIREVQTKLYTFGFNPGPIDGAVGPATQDAAIRYQANRGLPQTGTVDRALLEQLRQDPAPQVAQAPPPPRRPTRVYVRRSNDPFEGLRTAGDRLGRWLESITR